MGSGLIRRVAVSFAALLTAGGLSACQQAHQQVVSSEPCAAAIDEMAVAREIDAQIALLDRALIVCRSVEAMDRALLAHPGSIEVTAADYARRRCEDPPEERVRAGSICQSVEIPTTLPAEPEDPMVAVYLGVTLDGREVEIRASETLFTEGRPAAIVQIVDIGTEDGCPGVEAEYRRWSLSTFDPQWGDEASVYAQHALNVLANLGCPAPENR